MITSRLSLKPRSPAKQGEIYGRAVDLAWYVGRQRLRRLSCVFCNEVRGTEAVATSAAYWCYGLHIGLGRPQKPYFRATTQIWGSQYTRCGLGTDLPSAVPLWSEVDQSLSQPGAKFPSRIHTAIVLQPMSRLSRATPVSMNLLHIWMRLTGLPQSLRSHSEPIEP
jgi:hypothetical protein